jgi:hypothetical protein
MKRHKIIYWIATGLLSLMMVGSASFYFLQTEEVAKVFVKLGFPTFLIIPLATAKILAIITLLRNRSSTLVEWAYAGLFFNFVLAALAHYYAQDGEAGAALVALGLLIVSYSFKNKVR